MKVSAKLENGKLIINNVNSFNNFLKSFKNGTIMCLEVDKIKNIRSYKQNNALHLWFQQLSDTLNKDGFDMRYLIKESVSIPWTPYNIKENLWRPVQSAFFGKKSTKSLSTEETNRIFDVISREVGERTGIHIPFPSNN